MSQSRPTELRKRLNEGVTCKQNMEIVVLYSLHMKISISTDTKGGFKLTGIWARGNYRDAQERRGHPLQLHNWVRNSFFKSIIIYQAYYMAHLWIFIFDTVPQDQLHLWQWYHRDRWGFQERWHRAHTK